MKVLHVPLCHVPVFKVKTFENKILSKNKINFNSKFESKSKIVSTEAYAYRVIDKLKNLEGKHNFFNTHMNSRNILICLTYLFNVFMDVLFLLLITIVVISININEILIFDSNYKLLQLYICIFI